ncbi:MAG: hypothetical protein K8S97_16005, partial [Anaerolineae bacterium]|nr:hypothetical protein [Anaerolineae bacterium]
MLKLKHLSGVLLVTLLVAGGLVSVAAQDDAALAHVVIYVDVPVVFDAVVESFQAEMDILDYTEGETVTYTMARDADALAAALDAGADLLVSIPGGAVFHTEVDLGDTPVIFVASRDPLAEGLVESLTMSGVNTTTGVLQPDFTGTRLALTLDLLPDADTIYVAYDPAPHTPEAELIAVANVIEEHGIDLALAEVAFGDADAVAAAVAAIPAEADAIFIITPARALISAEWSTAALDLGVPLVLEYTASYPVFMTYGPDLAGMGAQSAPLAYAVLGGVNPGNLQVVTAEPMLTFNVTVADDIGVEIPDALLNEAAVIYHAEQLDGGAPDEEPAAEPTAELSACQATLTHPGGSNAICMDVACDVPLDSSFITYADRVPVESCADEGLIGICETEAFTMFHYDGEVSAVARGCGMLQGEWAEVAGDGAGDGEPVEEPTEDAAEEMPA